MPAVSKAQQRFMGMVHAAQKGDMENPSPEVEKAADSMSDKDAKDYASTSHKGLPNKKENMITRNRLKEIVKEVMVEEEDYQTFFKKALEKTGKSIPDMSDDEKKAFFNKIDTAWDAKGEKNEELTGDQHKLDVDKDGEIEASDLAALRAGKTNENISAELPKATIPSAVKQKMAMAIDKIKDAKLSNVQKLQLVAQVVDSLGIDKSQLGSMASKIRSKMESVNEGKKVFKVNPGIGKAKYSISSHDGKKTHKDGSDFYDIEIFNNKVDLEKGIKKYTSNGFMKESVNEASSFNGYVSSTDGKTFTLYNSNKKKIKDVSFDDLQNKYMKTYIAPKLKDFRDNFDKNTSKGKYFQWWKGKLVNVQLSGIDESVESVSEGVSSAEMDKIKGAVEAAKSFMSVGAELKKLGMKYTFATEPLPIYIIQPTPNNRVAIVNKKYVSKPDFVVGDIAVGVMEGKSVNEGLWPKSKLPQSFQFALAPELKKNFKGIFYSIGDDIYHNDKKVLSVDGDRDSVNSIIAKLKKIVK
jgi:hypothetical protein